MKDASFLQRFYFVQFVFTTLYPMIPEHAGNQVLHVKHFVSPFSLSLYIYSALNLLMKVKMFTTRLIYDLPD